MDDVRGNLAALVQGTGESLAALSRMLRRNPAYLHQFLYRSSPRRLAEDDRRLLAAHFNVEETVLGGAMTVATVAVPYLSVRAAAGAGLSAEDERLIRMEPFAPRFLRESGISPDMASLIAAAGDSMAPHILDGDKLLVDRGRPSLAGGGIFVFRRDGALSVKRLSTEGRRVRLASDNPDYPDVTVDGRAIEIIGRVKLLIRRPE